MQARQHPVDHRSRWTRNRFSRAFAVRIACLAVLGLLNSVAAQGSEGTPGRQRAVLIGVEKYAHMPVLKHILNDVEELSRTLRERAGYEVLELVETAPEARRRTGNSVLRGELPRWLSSAREDDDVLVYFSGHGFRGRDGKLYLAPVDFDPRDPASSGISVAWLRDQLGKCKARSKVLVVDACHAGSERDAQDPGLVVSAKDLLAPFAEATADSMTGVVTLASSGSEQVSLVWDAKRQSLFSYWLNQGLRGHADADGNAEVTIDELYNYTYENVVAVSEKLTPGRVQTPARIIPAQLRGVPTVVRVKPLTLEQLLHDMAEQLATAMHVRGLPKLGVLELVPEASLRQSAGTDFALLGRLCAQRLEEHLIRKSAMKFDVVEHGVLAHAAKGQDFDAVHTVELKELADAAGGVPVIALGTVRSRQGQVVTLACKLVDAAKHTALGYAGGTALLNESEWAMLGRSVAVQPSDRPPAAAPAAPDSRFELWDRRSQRLHPMRDPAFVFRVKIAVRDPASARYAERLPEFRDNAMLVPLRKGDVYRIEVQHAEWLRNRLRADEDRADEVVLMRVLVDGLSTLPETVESPVKGMSVEATPKARHLPAQRVNLDQASFWVLDAKSGGNYSIDGFYSKIGSGGEPSEYREFQVVEAHESLAARQRFSEEIGVITVAFYAPKPAGPTVGGTRGVVGTGAGETRTIELQTHQGAVPGDLLAVVHLRYAEPNMLENSAPE